MDTLKNKTRKAVQSTPARCPYYAAGAAACRLCSSTVHPAKRRLYCESACPGAYRACLFWCRYSL